MKTILLVDDEKDIREILGFALEEHGFRVIEASEADEAKLVFSKEKIDLLITDYLMPRKNGADLVRELRNLGHATPVFIITGYSECPRQELIELKVNATIFKPFDSEEIATQAANVLK